MDPARLETLLEAVRAVQESVARLEREIMGTLVKGHDQTHPPIKQRSEADELLTLVELEEWL